MTLHSLIEDRPRQMRKCNKNLPSKSLMGQTLNKVSQSRNASTDKMASTSPFSSTARRSSLAHQPLKDWNKQSRNLGQSKILSNTMHSQTSKACGSQQSGGGNVSQKKTKSSERPTAVRLSSQRGVKNLGTKSQNGFQPLYGFVNLESTKHNKNPSSISQAFQMEPGISEILETNMIEEECPQTLANFL